VDAPPLLLASTSPQRRAILTQLGIPFEARRPAYVEDDPPGLAPHEAVRTHAEGKARSVGAAAGPVLGVDTAVVVDGAMLGKPSGPDEAGAMLRRLAGRAHDVVSGLCLLTAGGAEVEHDVTRVRFRPLVGAEIDAYVGTGEWRGRAGGYAIQGRGAALVERVEGDYLNVVGLPAALLVRLLATRLPGIYGFGMGAAEDRGLH
jgi:septum formation protein